MIARRSIDAHASPAQIRRRSSKFKRYDDLEVNTIGGV